MITEYIKSWVIKILDRYIEGLNKDALKLGIWQGNVELNNVRIKKDVIDLPYNLKYSYIGKLRIEIPWNNIFRINSIKILISDLHVIAGPLTTITNDMAEKRKLKQRENDLIKLSLLDLAKKITTEKQDTDVPITSWKLSFLRQLGKSLDIKIQNVHVRYEDEFTYAPEIISYGFIINSIRLKLSNNEELFEKEKINFASLEFERYVHKKFSITDFSLYCHLNDSLFANENETSTLEKMVNLLNKSKKKDDLEIQYILHPVNLNFQFSQLLGPDEEHLPRTLFDVKLSPIDISLDDLQLKMFYGLSKRIEELNMKIRIKEFRPRVRPAENPRAWWAFLKRIYIPNYKERVEKSSLKYLEKRRERRLLYIDLRKKRNNKTLTSAEKYQLDSLDRKLPLRDIRFFRALADIELYLMGERFIETHQTSYWNWLTFWKKRTPDSDNKSNILTTSLRNHLIESLGGKTIKTRKDKKVEKSEHSVLGRTSLPRFTIALYRKGKKSKDSLINFYLRNSYINVSIGFKRETDIGNRIQLDIREIGLKLPEKYSNGVHSLLISTSTIITLFFDKNSKNVIVELNNLNMKKSFISENNKFRNVYLLSPLFLSINADINETENTRITKIKTIGNKFALSISEKDLFFIVYLLVTLKEVLVDSLKKDWTPTIPDDIRRALSNIKEDKIIIESDEDEFMKNRFLISLTILDICISILDNTKGTNRILFDVLLSDIISDIDINGSNINASSHLKLSADYKNEQHKWYPLIKKWPLYIGFSQSDLSQKINVWTHKKLNVILSTTFLKNINEFTKSWNFDLIKALMADKNNSEKIIKQIIRSNNRGWREFQTTPDFQNKFVVMNELGSDLSYNIFYKDHIPHITFQVENFISPEVKLAPGKFEIQLEPAKIGSVVMLNCKLINQITYISLTSTIKIKNSCKSRRIRIGHIEHKNMNEHLIIERGQEIYLPWNWVSRNFLEFPVIIDGYKVQLEVPISKGSMYSIEVSFPRYNDDLTKKINWGERETLVEIKSPLRLINLSACDIQYKLLDNSKSNMDANHFILGSIPFESEEELFLENLNYNTIMISFKLPDSPWSNYTFIGYENRDEYVSFEMDYNEFPVYLDYEYDLTSLSISIYNKYWIINRLGVAIDIKNGVSENVNDNPLDIDDNLDGLPLLSSERILKMKPFMCDINEKEKKLSLRISYNNNEYIVSDMKNPLSLPWGNSKYFEVLACISEAKGEFFRTKLIYLKPRFMIKNNGDSILYFRVTSVSDNIEYEILPNQNQPLYLTFGEKNLSFSFKLSDFDWTSNITVDKTKTIPLKHTLDQKTIFSFIDILAENNVLIKISYEEQSYDHLKSVYLPNDVIIHPIETKSGTRYIPFEKDEVYQVTDYDTETEQKKEQNIIVNLSGAILTLVDDTEKIEVVSLVLDNIYFAMNIIHKYRSFDFRLRGLQIDNPHYRYTNSKFRNILIAHPSFKSQNKSDRNSECFLHIKAGQSYVYKDLTYLDLDVSLHEVYVTIDQGFIENLLGFIFKVSKYQESKLQSISSVIEEPEFEMGNSVYIHKMDISPIFVSITFSMSELSGKRKNYIPIALNLLGFQDLSISMNRLTKNQMFLHHEELTRILISFYKKEVLKQAYKVFTSLELIGSPMSIFNEFKHSIGSVFNEPFSPSTILIGSYSLLLHTASGFSNSTAKFTGIISKFLSRLVKEPTPRSRSINLFEDYESSLFQDRIWNLKDSIVDSIVGLVRQPFKRAMESGTKGLAIGTITGLIDLIAKPSIAVLDIIQGTADYYHKITNPTPLRWKAPTLYLDKNLSEKENIEQVLKNLKGQFPELQEIFEELEKSLRNRN